MRADLGIRTRVVAGHGMAGVSHGREKVRMIGHNDRLLRVTRDGHLAPPIVSTVVAVPFRAPATPS
jgi:hypothetical protein